MDQSKIYHIKENLSVCGFEGIVDRPSFESYGFEAHLQCVEGFEDWLKECVDVKCLSFDDGLPIPVDMIDEAQTWLSEHWDQDNKILISCAAGESRSVTMAACLLTLKTDTGFSRACKEVFTKVPGAYPHPNILVSAADNCGVLLDFDQLKGIYLNIPVQPPFPWANNILKDSLNVFKN